jgi:hypothetical protein
LAGNATKAGKRNCGKTTARKACHDASLRLTLFQG